MEHPIILPHGHPVVKEIIQSVHKELLRAGPESTLSVLRQANWPTKGRREGKTVLGKCLVCQRQRVGPCSHKMAPLPSEWVSSFSAFIHVGIDFAESHLNKGLHLHFQVRLFFSSRVLPVTYQPMSSSRRCFLWSVEEGSVAPFGPTMRRRSRVPTARSNSCSHRRIIRLSDKIDQEELQAKLSSRGIKWKFIVEHCR